MSFTVSAQHLPLRVLSVVALLVFSACGTTTGDGDSLATAGAGTTLPTAGKGAGLTGSQAGDGAAGTIAGTNGTAGSGTAGTGASGQLAADGGFGESLDGSTDEPIVFVPSAESLSRVGPYDTATMRDQPAHAAYQMAAIEYPTNATPPFGLVAVIPGYTESSAASISWWGPQLASHGFVVITIDTKTVNDCPDPRDKQLMAALGVLAAEHTRAGSPLEGKLDITKQAVMGHSMGGGASLMAATAHPELKAAIPMTPWSGGFAPCTGFVGPLSFGTVSVPSMIIAGKGDDIAPENTHAHPFYLSISSSTPKAYMEFIDGKHNVANSRNTNEALLTRYVVSWLRVYMDGDDTYKAFITGAEHDAVKSMFSRYESNL